MKAGSQNPRIDWCVDMAKTPKVAEELYQLCFLPPLISSQDGELLHCNINLYLILSRPSLGPSPGQESPLWGFLMSFHWCSRIIGTTMRCQSSYYIWSQRKEQDFILLIGQRWRYYWFHSPDSYVQYAQTACRRQIHFSLCSSMLDHLGLPKIRTPMFTYYVSTTDSRYLCGAITSLTR